MEYLSTDKKNDAWSAKTVDHASFFLSIGKSYEFAQILFYARS